MQRSVELARRVLVDLGSDVPTALRRFSPPLSSAPLRLECLVQEAARRGFDIDVCEIYHGENKIASDADLQSLVKKPSAESASAPSDSKSDHKVSAPVVLTLRKTASHAVVSSRDPTTNGTNHGWIIPPTNSAQSSTGLMHYSDQHRQLQQDDLSDVETVKSFKVPEEGVFAVIGPSGSSVYSSSQDFDTRFDTFLREGLPCGWRVVVPPHLGHEYCSRLAASGKPVQVTQSAVNILKAWHTNVAQASGFVAGLTAGAKAWRLGLRRGAGAGAGSGITRSVAAGCAAAVVGYVVEEALTQILPRVTKVLSNDTHAILVTSLAGSGIELQSFSSSETGTWCDSSDGSSIFGLQLHPHSK